MVEIPFEEVPSLSATEQFLISYEDRVGRTLAYRDRIALLLVEFYKGRQDVLTLERSRYGESLAGYTPPAIYIEPEGEKLCTYNYVEHRVKISMSALQGLASHPMDEYLRLKSKASEPEYQPPQVTSLEVIRDAGREEFDHSIYFFRHPEKRRLVPSDRKKTHALYDSLEHEYHGEGIKYLLGKKAGESRQKLESHMKRLKAALPILKKDKSRT